MNDINLHLIRHGETVGAGPNSGYIGDPPLTETGFAQAQLTAPVLERLNIGSIAVSPMLRAVQTAKPAAESLSLIPRYYEGLQEIALGEYPGDRVAGRERPRIEFDEWGGEAGSKFYIRVHEEFRNLVRHVRSGTESNVAVIAHGGTINSILDFVENIPFDGYMRHLLRNCSVTTLTVSSESIQVSDVNVVTHLPKHLITS